MQSQQLGCMVLLCISTPEAEKLAMDEDEDSGNVEWITVKGSHIPVKAGQTRADTVMQFLKEKREKSFSEEEIRKDFEKLATSFKNATPENYYKKRENTKDASEIYKKYKGQFDNNSSMYKEGSDPFYFEYDGETYTGMEEPTPARYIDKNSTVRLTKGAYIHKIPLEDFDKSKFKPLGYLRQKYVKERGGMVDKFFFDKNEKADDLKFAKDEWDENKHPRNKDGKFGNGSGQKSIASSSKYNIVETELPKEEYGKVIHELNNNLSKEERNKKRITRQIGDYTYIVINNGFNEYIIVSKKGIDDGID